MGTSGDIPISLTQIQQTMKTIVFQNYILFIYKFSFFFTKPLQKIINNVHKLIKENFPS